MNLIIIFLNIYTSSPTQKLIYCTYVPCTQLAPKLALTINRKPSFITQPQYGNNTYYYICSVCRAIDTAIILQIMYTINRFILRLGNVETKQ